MSASLVGSEMCIRDRPPPPPLPHEQPRPAQGPAADDGDERQPPAPDAGPVSYTHLTLPTICSV
eukprot:7361709-Alexandrium_andersonii.AAC.1